jgi:HEAT repeat protein
MVVSLESVHANIYSQDADERIFALRELSILGLKGEHAGISLVVNCLEEKDERVRKAAAEALRKFADKGHPKIIAALLPKLRHRRSNVKKVVLEFLGELSEVGDKHVVTEVCTCFERHAFSAEVASAAVDTLGVLALQGDQADQEFVVTSMTSLLSHKPVDVRKAAVQALPKLSERGITIDISRVSGCLDDTQSEVRIAAIKAIAKIAIKGDKDALKAVSGCFSDEECQVRLAAMCAIAEIAEKGNANAFAYSRLVGLQHGKEGGSREHEASSSTSTLPPIPPRQETPEPREDSIRDCSYALLNPTCRRRSAPRANDEGETVDGRLPPKCNLQ